MRKKILLAITGLPGSGKSEAVKIFERNGYQKIWFGQIIVDEVKKRNLKINERNERKIREEIRKKYGMAACAILSLPKIKEYLKKGKVVLESMYSWREYLILKKEFPKIFKVLALYAPAYLRYDRLAKRKYRPLILKESKSRDFSQIENLDIAGPIVMADYMIINNKNLKELYKKTKEIINKIE